MHVIHHIAQLRQHLARFDCPALVPTMGNLHAGHLALVRHARTLGDVTVASIFVNRLQFLPHEDFDRYPRTLQADCAQLEQAGCDLVFAPSESELYPQPQTLRVQPDPALADVLEGQFRPGFFNGVCTVVLKLFAIVFGQSKGGGHAVFGLKDYQQYLVLRHLVQQLALPLQVHGLPTERAADGLALSSRNAYLAPAERAQALQLLQALQALAAQVQAQAAAWASAPASLGAADAGVQATSAVLAELEAAAVAALQAQGWQCDYLCVRRRADLQPPAAASDWQADGLIALGAARLGRTRLIDNWLF